jgi:hypothetical protein
VLHASNPSTGEAESKGSLEHRSSRPVRQNNKELVSKKIKLYKIV